MLQGGGCTVHAGSKCRTWYLAMTHYVLQISCERTNMFLCPASGNDNRLTSSWFSFPVIHQAHVTLRNKNLDLVLFCCGVYPLLYHHLLIASSDQDHNRKTKTMGHFLLEMRWTELQQHKHTKTSCCERSLCHYYGECDSH